MSFHAPTTTSPTILSSSVNQRMQMRLEGLHSAAETEDVLSQKQQLLQRSVTVHFVDTAKGVTPPAVQIFLKEHPNWIVYDASLHSFIVDERTIRFNLDDPENALLPQPQDIVSYPMRTSEARTRIKGSAKSGYIMETNITAQKIAEALNENMQEVSIPVTFQQATLHLFTSSGTEHLTLLSEGFSDYAKSPLGRSANIQKALNEQLNGIIIPVGSTFSFSESMRGNSGWSNAMVIKNGGKLVAEPGGGICQAATTLFRAALLSGLPIINQRNHSLYISYYEAYGVGLDATVYGDVQDFRFKNDTNAPLVIVAKNEGTKAIAQIYGKPDGRTVQLEGPFFSTSNDGFSQKLNIKQIGWQHSVVYPDTRKIERNFVSTYAVLPKTLRQKYPKPVGMSLLREHTEMDVGDTIVMR